MGDEAPKKPNAVQNLKPLNENPEPEGLRSRVFVEEGASALRVKEPDRLKTDTFPRPQLGAPSPSPSKNPAIFSGVARVFPWTLAIGFGFAMGRWTAPAPTVINPATVTTDRAPSSTAPKKPRELWSPRKKPHTPKQNHGETR